MIAFKDLSPMLRAAVIMSYIMGIYVILQIFAFMIYMLVTY